MPLTGYISRYEPESDAFILHTTSMGSLSLRLLQFFVELSKDGAPMLNVTHCEAAPITGSTALAKDASAVLLFSSQESGAPQLSPERSLQLSTLVGRQLSQSESGFLEALLPHQQQQQHDLTAAVDAAASSEDDRSEGGAAGPYWGSPVRQGMLTTTDALDQDMQVDDDAPANDASVVRCNVLPVSGSGGGSSTPGAASFSSFREISRMLSHGGRRAEGGSSGGGSSSTPSSRLAGLGGNSSADRAVMSSSATATAAAAVTALVAAEDVESVWGTPPGGGALELSPHDMQQRGGCSGCVPPQSAAAAAVAATAAPAAHQADQQQQQQLRHEGGGFGACISLVSPGACAVHALPAHLASASTAPALWATTSSESLQRVRRDRPTNLGWWCGGHV